MGEAIVNKLFFRKLMGGKMGKKTGVVSIIKSDYPGTGFGFIMGDDGISYYFSNKSLPEGNVYIDDFSKGDEVAFEAGDKLDEKGRGTAYSVERMSNTLDSKYKQSESKSYVNDKQNTRNELLTLVISRFGEFYYENNMLGDTSAIDEDLLLFGDRGKIADSIVNRCEQGKNSGIFGLRRSGKTSVLKAVCRRLERAGIKYVFIQSRSLLEHIDGVFNMSNVKNTDEHQRWCKDSQRWCKDSQGIATELLRHAEDSLKAEGINKIALFVFNRNEAGNAFWEKQMVRIDT